MWIGSPLRGAFRLLTFLSVTLVLVPIYFVILALRIRPIIRWMPVAYHRFVRLWGEADPALQARVEAARAAIRRLEQSGN